MSVKVDLAKLADRVADHDYAYLLTVSENLRPHAVAVQPVVRDTSLWLGVLGNRTLANLAAHSDVTVLFPPRERGGYSLIVDGRAATAEDGVLVVPSHAVLHRPTDHPVETADGSCGNDCLPVSLT
jgi:hypothetical protein